MSALCLMFEKKENWQTAKELLKDKWILKRMNTFKCHKVSDVIWKKLENEYTKNE